MIRNIYPISSAVMGIVVATLSYLLGRTTSNVFGVVVGDVMIIGGFGVLTFLISITFLSWRNTQEIYNVNSDELEGELRRIVGEMLNSVTDGEAFNLNQFSTQSPINEEALDLIRKRSEKDVKR